MALQVCLANPYELHYDWNSLCQHVQLLLRPVVELFDERNPRNRLHNVSVRSSFDPMPVTGDDLLVYVVPTRLFGFVGVDFASELGGREDADGLTGFTAGEVCSEAYAAEPDLVGGDEQKLRVDRLTTEGNLLGVESRRDPSCLAKVIFHEFMHNRSGQGDRMHDNPELTIGRSVDCRQDVSPADRAFLADHLRRDPRNRRWRQQWTGGWAVVNNRMPRHQAPSPQNPHR